jgi:hypothetical protein
MGDMRLTLASAADTGEANATTGFMLITEPEETMLALMTRITHGWTTARFARIFFSV